MGLNKIHWIGLISAAVAIIADLIFFLRDPADRSLFFFIIGIALVLAFFPFVLGIAAESKKEQEVGEMFLEFSRNLAESVTTGTPVSKSIINVSKKDYGALSPYIQKLANQIALGIPVNQALQIFSRDVGSQIISRAVALISEAERAGGEIDYILDSVANSIAEVEKLKKERKAAISNLIVQGYIIFFIFIGIMLVMEFKILPLTSGIGSFGGLGVGSGGLQGVGSSAATSSSNLLSPEQLSRPFLYLLLTQGIFTGLTIGKLSEGSIRAGVKHSFILSVVALLVSTGARAFIG